MVSLFLLGEARRAGPRGTNRKDVFTMNILSCSDQEFNEYKAHWQRKLIAIHLPSDINSGIGKQILSELDEAYAYLRVDYGQVESAKDRAESIIRQNERSKAEGRNEDDRKKTATQYLENYPIEEDHQINMYDYQRLIQTRYAAIKSLIDIINNKQQRLITMTGLMKIDSELGSGMHS